MSFCCVIVVVVRGAAEVQEVRGPSVDAFEDVRRVEDRHGPRTAAVHRPRQPRQQPPCIHIQFNSIHSFIHLFIHLFIYSFIHLFIYSFI
jgi:hypothetical protein